MAFETAFVSHICHDGTRGENVRTQSQANRTSRYRLPPPGTTLALLIQKLKYAPLVDFLNSRTKILTPPAKKVAHVYFRQMDDMHSRKDKIDAVFYGTYHHM